MSLFYNPRKRKPRVWIIVFFALMPFIVIIVTWLSTRDIVKQHKIEKEKEESVDIFDKF